MGFSLRHARSMYVCMLATIYIRVHPYTHTIKHVCARMNIRVAPTHTCHGDIHTYTPRCMSGPCTHAPRTHTFVHACTYEYVPTRMPILYMCTLVRVYECEPAHHTQVHTHVRVSPYTHIPRIRTFALACAYEYTRSSMLHP